MGGGADPARTARSSFAKCQWLMAYGCPYKTFTVSLAHLYAGYCPLSCLRSSRDRRPGVGNGRSYRFSYWCCSHCSTFWLSSWFLSGSQAGKGPRRVGAGQPRARGSSWSTGEFPLFRAIRRSHNLRCWPTFQAHSRCGSACNCVAIEERRFCGSDAIAACS